MKYLVTSILVAVLAGSAVAVTAPQSNRPGGVTLRANVPTGSVLDPGDQISFEYQVAQDAAVVVIDIDTQGYVHLLSPSGEPDRSGAHEAVRVPDDGSDLVADGEPGVEFLFAISVDDPAAIDADALASLRAEGVPRRIDGDPFVAANMIAAELVRDVSQHAVFLGYTYFYISERVEYPCYLCGTCDGSPTSGPCEGARIVQDFDRRIAMSYPLQRGYNMVDLAASNTAGAPDDVALPDDEDDVNVNFYPYGSEVRYADPMAVNLWYDWGWYDPYFWYYPYHYPYCGSGWSFSIGFGWGWGCGWGGYYCSGWYDPWYGGCGGGGGGYYPYPSYPASYPNKYKAGYTGGNNTAPTLASNRKYASQRDGNLRVASGGARPTAAKSTAFRSKRSPTSFSAYDSGRRVKTSVSGSRSMVRQTFDRSRNAPGQRSHSVNGTRAPSYRSKDTAPGQRTGRSVIQRNGASRSKSSAGYSAPRSSSRSSAPAPQMKGSGSRGTFAPSYRGSSGSRGGSYHGGGAPRGGGAMKGSSHGRGR